MTWRPAVALLVSTIGATAAGAGSLGTLLDAVTQAARSPDPACADVRIEGPAADVARPAILCTRGDAVYVEVRDGARALLRPGTIQVAGADGPTPAPPGAALADTDVLLEDLVPFTAESLAFPQVSDEGPRGTVVTSAPEGPSAYALLVLTIDPNRTVVTAAKYYEGRVTNLVKMRTDELVDVGGRLRPAVITMERLEPPRTTRLRFTWRDGASPPEALFTPAGLAEPSGLAWPDA